jgi:hypothetical protein
MVSFNFQIPFTPITIGTSGIQVTGLPVVGTATIGTSGIETGYGTTTEWSEVIAETPAVVSEAAHSVLDTGDDWLQGAIAGAGELAAAHQEAEAQQVDIGDIVSDLFNAFSNPETSPLTPYAEAYVDWYEGDTTTAEFISDPIGTTTAGVVDVITDVVGTDIVVGSIEAAATPLAAVLDPITEPIGEGIEKLIVPAAIVGGAYLLLK